MSACQQAKRRRRQMMSNYSHLPVRKRPNYKMRDPETSARHLQKLAATERRMKASSNKKKG